MPARLPFDPPLQYQDDLLMLLSSADRAIGKLDAAADMLPNPDLFVSMYVRKEAVLSSQIEGVTQASLSEFIQHEARQPRRALPADIAEVVNYVHAMNYGLRRLDDLPLSNRLIKEIHAILMQNVRGEERNPGEFRKTQNWIGSHGSDLGTAMFVPPPPGIMLEAMGDLELYLHDQSPVPVLVKAGLVHYQFETIHPFLDGNGRIGRLLVVFYLCQQDFLRRPLLYLSEFINAHKDEYYNRLQTARDRGDIEGWMTFFLTAIWRVSEAAAATAHRILALREEHRRQLQQRLPNSPYGLQLLDKLYEMPLMNVNLARKTLEVSYPTANNLMAAFVDLGILREITGLERNRMFMYQTYVDMMEHGLDVGPGAQPRSP